jgi:hypothetical protein
MEESTRTIRLKVTPRVAGLMAGGVSADEQRRAIAGELPLSDQEHLTVLFLLANRGGDEIRRMACIGMRKMPASRLLPLLAEEELHPQLLQFIAGYRLDDVEVMDRLMAHPRLDPRMLPQIARKAGPAVLELLAARFAGSPEGPVLLEAVTDNPAAGDGLLALFGEPDDLSSQPEEDLDDSDLEELADEEDGDWEEPENEEGMSKYQMTMVMGVAEKIKAALNGDKEWRKILIQDTNKLVSTAVLKNPRITEGEVLTVVKNKSSNEDMIRLVTQNREWMKNYAIKHALIVHPRVAPGQAIRYMNILTDRDLKVLAKSREVSKVVVNNARRLLNARQQRR